MADLTNDQCTVLYHLMTKCHSGYHGCTLSQIAEELEWMPDRLTATVKELHQLGFIAKVDFEGPKEPTETYNDIDAFFAIHKAIDAVIGEISAMYSPKITPKMAAIIVTALAWQYIEWASECELTDADVIDGITAIQTVYKNMNTQSAQELNKVCDWVHEIFDRVKARRTATN